MAATSSEEFKMVEPPSDKVQNSGVKNECNMKDETLREYLSGAQRMNEHLICSLNYVVEHLKYEYIAETTYGSDFKTSSALHEIDLVMENEEEEHLQEPHLLVGSLKMDVLSADCTPAAETFRKLSPHLGKWERCDFGGKHRARYCHLLLAPPFRLTPNEAKRGSP